MGVRFVEGPSIRISRTPGFCVTVFDQHSFAWALGPAEFGSPPRSMGGLAVWACKYGEGWTHWLNLPCDGVSVLG